MLGAGYFLKIAEINFQQEKPICPNLKNKFLVTWPFHRLPRPLRDLKSLLCLLRNSWGWLVASLDFHLHVTTANISSLYLIKCPGRLFNFRGPSGGIFITVTVSTKLIHFQQKYQESLNIAKYPLHQLIHLGCLEIHITLWNSNIYARILAHCNCVAIVSLSLF